VGASETDRREAERLVDLDGRGRDIEAVAAVLSARRHAEESAAELDAIDRGFLDAIEQYFGSGGGSAPDGP